MNHARSALLLAIFLAMATACNPDGKPPLEKGDLLGRWELERAWRNGKQTETLTGTFYEFSDGGEMRTNLTPTLTEEQFPFSFRGEEIVQHGTTPVTYKLESLSDTAMVMSMTINNFPFRLQLRKAR